MIGPNIEKLAEENADATVIKIDVDKHPEIAAEMCIRDRDI